MTTPLHTTYPAVADAWQYLQGLGFRSYGGAAAVSDIVYNGLGSKCAAASALFEQQSQWTPYLSSGQDEDCFYDPPFETRTILLNTGLLLLTSLSTGWAPGASGFVQTLGQGFRLVPQNAAHQGRAFEAVEFLSGGYGGAGGIGYPFGANNFGWGGGPYGMAGSVKITGRWGRVLAPPDDVWQAVLEKAVLMSLPALHMALGQRLIEFSEGGVSEKYNADPMKVVRDSLTSGWQDVVDSHKRVIVYG